MDGETEAGVEGEVVVFVLIPSAARELTQSGYMGYYIRVPRSVWLLWAIDAATFKKAL
jgi:hypothetical protein